jgi:cytidine deaminase
MKEKIKKLRKLAYKASTLSHSPYSKAKVGSAVEMSDGSLFSGCNIENSSFGGTICAERVAIFKAISEGKKSIKRVYVYTVEGWPPCGLCRQVMSEFAHKDLEIIIGNKKGEEKTYSFNTLFPLAFTPDHLIK